MIKENNLRTFPRTNHPEFPDLRNYDVSHRMDENRPEHSAFPSTEDAGFRTRAARSGTRRGAERQGSRGAGRRTCRVAQAVPPRTRRERAHLRRSPAQGEGCRAGTRRPRGLPGGRAPDAKPTSWGRAGALARRGARRCGAWAAATEPGTGRGAEGRQGRSGGAARSPPAPLG